MTERTMSDHQKKKENRKLGYFYYSPIPKLPESSLFSPLQLAPDSVKVALEIKTARFVLVCLTWRFSSMLNRYIFSSIAYLTTLYHCCKSVAESLQLLRALVVDRLMEKPFRFAQ